jgi:hypothetical protein
MPSWNVNGGCVMTTATVSLSDLLKQEPRPFTFMAAFPLYSDLPFLFPYMLYSSRCPIQVETAIVIRTSSFVGKVNLIDNTVMVLFPTNSQFLY